MTDDFQMRIIFVIASLFPVTAFARFVCPAPAADVVKDSTKLLIVITPSWDAKQGTIHLWRRSSPTKNWSSASTTQPTVLGKNGMGWGYKFQKFAGPGQPLKHEGDGRTPAGVHTLGKKFGFAAGSENDYIPLTSSTFCVDDPASKFYNSIINATQFPKDWNSAEDMSKIDQYKFGMDVRYESSASEKTGSCIFLHIWRAPDAGTAGCVSMAENVIENLHAQLDAPSHPAVAIFPASEWARWAPCFPGTTAN